MNSISWATPKKRRGILSKPAQARREISVSDLEKAPLHVLVVDDEPLIRWSVTETLADLGLDVEEAANAASALKAISTAAVPYDVIVLDLRLPDMNDLSLLATIRQVLPDAAIVLMTAFGSPEIVSEATKLGIRGVLSKPFELGDMSRIVLGQNQVMVS